MSENLSSKAQRICGLCNDKDSKYCCPRCEVFYCSLDCYKSESHCQCSESFYRECVTNELASNQTDDVSRNKMMDILRKMNEGLGEEEFEDLMENVDDVDSDDEEGIDLSDRIQGIDLNNADELWNALTEDERNEFEAMLNKGDIESILPHWEPWWMYHRKEKKIQDIDEKNDKEEERLKQCPALREVPSLSTLTTKQPSPAIRYNITNVLASYAFIMRYFNGEVDPTEVTTCLLDICANLDYNMNFDSPVTPMESVVQKCLQSNFITTDEESLDIMKQDTLLILQGPSKENKIYYCLAALSHLHEILSQAKNNSIAEKKGQKGTFSKKFPEHKAEHFPKLDSSKVKKCLKKIEYYLSYVKSCGMELE